MILITGVSGFIGSKLLEAISKRFGAQNVVAFTSKPLEQHASIVYTAIKNFNLNQVDYNLLASVEVIIHAGAFIPKSTLESNDIVRCNENILFTQALLALPLPKIRKIIFLSTVDVYDIVELTTENTVVCPSTLYGMSKLYCEKMVNIFKTNKNIMGHILRVGHVYGPGEEVFKKFLPIAIQNIIQNKPIELWGDGSDIRSFIYINDVVEAIINAISLDEEVGPVNIVSSVPCSLLDLLNRLKIIAGKPIEINTHERLAKRRDCVFDNTKLRTYLLKKEKSLEEGLKREYEYFERLCKI